MKAKVVEFITNLSDGGAENLVKDYAIMLRDRMDVTVLTIRNFTHTAVYRTLKENGVKIVSVYPRWNIAVKLFNKIFGRWYIPYKLNQLIQNEKPDCIHAHLYILKYLKRISGKIQGIKLLYSCHSGPSRYFGPDFPEQTDAAKYLIEHNNLQFVALHEDMRDEINAMFGVNDTVVIRNGVDFRRFENLAETQAEIRKELGIPETAFVVGHVGRFTFQKNHEFLIEVFREVCKKSPNAVLLLVGSGDLREQVENKLREYNLLDRTKILSNRTDVPRLMKAMDVFVFPSIIEGFGIVLVEAQISGLRCLISDAVPAETHLSHLAIPMELAAGPERWAEAALAAESYSDLPNRLEEYDMRREIDRLEQLYCAKNPSGAM